MNANFVLSRWLAAVLLLPLALVAQGPLTPPGPPGPTMKSLAQIEPRTPIATVPFTITNSGSYYLTGDLLGTSGQPGIVIAASSVTIDLGGFSIVGAQVGISASGPAAAVVLRNGTVRGCVGAGVDLAGVSKCDVEQLLVCDNGGVGLSVGQGSSVTRSQAFRNGGVGMALDSASSVLRCVIRSNSADGLVLAGDSLVSENILDRNGSSALNAGLLVIGDGNRIEANNMSGNNGRGLRVTGASNLIVKNSARGNSVVDYDIASGNNYGQIVFSPGANFVVPNAWANFSTACPSGQSLCGNTCLDPLADPNNCGSCGNVCPSAPNALPSCANGSCGLTCDPNYGDCNNDMMDGCETFLSSVSNCGACNVVCPVGWSCNAGVCVSPSCATDMDCAPSGFCQSGSCIPKYPVGQACMGNNQCQSGICQFGVCQSNDTDMDGVPNGTDNCPNISNPSQADIDADAVGDVCDNCPNTSNPGQQDTDNDSIGDACDPCSPTAEVCNGADDDCDGFVDEGLGSTTCGTGACQTTIQNCVGGSPQTCTPGIPSSEICDNIDNDCDGMIDEGFGNLTCGVGACQNSVPSCVAGVPQTCTPNSPSVEVCDGFDNDCDGSVDESNPGGGAACNTGLLGSCAQGTTVCQSGALVCLQNQSPSAEVCDGWDNDCDGMSDEGNPGGGSACNTGLLGACSPGTTACVSGSISCVQNVSSSSEVCDGQDNDCDGASDEGVTCPAGQSCISGSCKKQNGVACGVSSECASNFCVDGVCCNAACSGTCQACNIAGSVGTCSNIPSGTDPGNECSGTLNCNGAGACQTALVNGAACSTNAQCSSGFCVDGVCCDSACSGSCQACTTSKKGSGADGTCGNIANNTDPDNECALNCNGAGACQSGGPPPN